jgi:hypothetical protein
LGRSTEFHTGLSDTASGSVQTRVGRAKTSTSKGVDAINANLARRAGIGSAIVNVGLATRAGEARATEGGQKTQHSQKQLIRHNKRKQQREEERTKCRHSR